MQTTLVTMTTSAGGFARPFKIAISPFWIQFTASSAAFNAGIAEANYVSQSTLIAFASSAINWASASSIETAALILSAASVSAVTITSLAAVSLPVWIRIGYKSISSYFMKLTFDSVSIRQS